MWQKFGIVFLNNKYGNYQRVEFENWIKEYYKQKNFPQGATRWRDDESGLTDLHERWKLFIILSSSYYFAPYLYYGSEIFLSNGCVFYPMFANCVHANIGSLFTSERENSFHQYVANLPYNATEIVRFLKTFKIWVFLKKINGFSEKKFWIFSKSLKFENLL